jgi:hypothetical protein
MLIYQKIGAGLSITGLAGRGLGIGITFRKKSNMIETFCGLRMETSSNVDLDFLSSAEKFLLFYYKSLKLILNDKTLTTNQKQKKLDFVDPAKNRGKQIEKVGKFLMSKKIDVRHSFIRVSSPFKKEFYKKFNNLLKFLETHNKSALDLFALSLSDSLLLSTDYLNDFALPQGVVFAVKKTFFLTSLARDFVNRCKTLASFTIELSDDEMFQLSFHFGEILELTGIVKLERDLLQGRSPYIYTVKSSLLHSLVGFKNLRLPSLVQPSKWEINPINLNTPLSLLTRELDNGSFNLNELNIRTREESSDMSNGDYSYTQSKYRSGVHYIGESSVVRVKTPLVDSMNYLQGQPYTLNKDCLKYLDSNKLRCLLEFLKAYDLESLDIFVTENTKNGIISSISEKKSLQVEDLIAIKSCYSYVFGSKKDQAIELHYRVISLENRLKLLNYKKFLVYIFKFIFDCKVAQLFKNYTLWFSTFVDFRSRVYFLGNSIKPQGDILSKFLLDLSTSAKTKFSKDALELKGKLQSLKVNKTLKGKQFFELKKLEFKSSSTIGLDVSSSGAQILSGLSGHEKGLLSTNFLKEGNINKDNDFYEEIREKFLNYFSTQKKKIKALPPTKLYLGLDVKVSLELFALFELIFDRQFVKGWSMRFFYSEGKAARLNSLETSLPAVYSGMPIVSKLLRKIASLLNTFIDQPIVGMINFIKSKFDTTLVKNTYLNLSGPHLSFAKRFVTSVDGDFRYRDRNQKTRSHALVKKTNEADTAKILRSCVVHFVHFLDASLAHNIILESKKNKIALYSNHDCFHVLHENSETIKNLYFKSFVDIILKSDPLKAYLELNNIKLSKDDLKQLAEWAEARKLLVKKIKNKTLKESFYILKP